MQPEDLSQGAKEILIKALEADKGKIRTTGRDGVNSILIDRDTLGNNTDTLYSKALNKLIKTRLIEKQQLGGNVYGLTTEGRKMAKEVQ